MSLRGQVGSGLESRVWSSSCAVDDVCDEFRLDDADSDALDLREGWASRWTATWSFDKCEVSCPIREIGSIPMRGAEPVRHFSWHPRQHHRPGLELLASTGRLHGFESLEERNFLRVLDFAGGIGDVLSQPFRIRFATAGGRWHHHIPDYLVAMPDGRWLIDVRPRVLVKDKDRAYFAAAEQVARAAGWRYSVVAGWRTHLLPALEAIRAEWRPMTHCLEFQEEMLGRLERGSARFGELVGATALPVVARAHALHLLWWRRIGIDLGSPLGDASVVALAGRASW